MNLKNFHINIHYRDQALTLHNYDIFKYSLRAFLIVNLLLFLFGFKTLPYYYPGELAIEKVYANVFDVQNSLLRIGFALVLIFFWIILIYSILRVIVEKFCGWKLLDYCFLIFAIFDMILVILNVRPTQRLDYFELWNPIFAFFVDFIFFFLFLCTLHNTESSEITKKQSRHTEDGFPR